MQRRITMHKWMTYYGLTNKFVIEKVKPRLFKVIGDFSIHLDRVNCSITLPDQFKTNLASIPRICFSLFPRSDEYDLAAAVHDYLYELGLFPRKICDLIFRDILILCEVDKKTYEKMYKSVRIFGGRHYKKGGNK